MKPDIELDKRTIILIGAVLAAGAIFLLLIKPLWSKANNIAQEVQALNNELSNARQLLKEGVNLDSDRHPLSRGEISVAINEIMEVGASLDIDIFSTNPQKIQKIKNSKYPILPIHMDLQATYEKFGKFLGALEALERSIVTVKHFNINRKPIILPEIAAELVVELHLKEGEGG